MSVLTSHLLYVTLLRSDTGITDAPTRVTTEGNLFDFFFHFHRRVTKKTWGEGCWGGSACHELRHPNSPSEHLSPANSERYTNYIFRHQNTHSCLSFWGREGRICYRLTFVAVYALLRSLNEGPLMKCSLYEGSSMKVPLSRVHYWRFLYQGPLMEVPPKNAPLRRSLYEGPLGRFINEGPLLKVPSSTSLYGGP